MIVKQVVNELY